MRGARLGCEPLLRDIGPVARCDARLRRDRRLHDERWGSEQALRYLANLRRAADRLVEQPALGRARSDLPGSYRIYRSASHLLVYRVDAANDRLLVLRILHVRMDVAARVREMLRRDP